LQEDAIKGEEGLLRVADYHEDVEERIHLRGPLQIEASDQGNDLEVVGEYPYQHGLRFVPFRILKQITKKI
jgi:hypothetical protein